MTIRIKFLFIGEGAFDDRLVPHLRQCCVLAGADEADGITVPFSRFDVHVGHSILDKLEFALEHESNVNLLFIHRDSDSRDPEPRYEEIHAAVSEVASAPKHVPVVPVQETEAWLLDEQSIRTVAENPKGIVPLDLPVANRVEEVSNPKDLLREKILLASEQTGRRYRRLEQKIPQKCGLMIDALDPSGTVKEIPSWKRMFRDLETAIAEISASD